MRAKWIMVWVVLTVLVAASMVFYIWQRSRQEVPLSEQYATEPAARADVSRTVLAAGTIGARETVSLYMTRTQTAGRIHVKEGDAIQAGDLLISWDVTQDRIELERKREQTAINLENARLGLSLIGQPAQGNERMQYESDVTTAEKNVFDAENDIASTEIRLTQQQRKLEDAEKTLTRYVGLLAAGALTQAEYDNALSAYENAQEGLTDLQLQLSIKERTLTLRQTQLSEAKQRLANALDKLSEQSNTLKYQQQENLIRLHELELAQIEDDLAKIVTETRSPVTGYVVSVPVTEGASAAKGSLLIEVADFSTTVARADVTEYDAPLLAEGQRVTLATSGLPDKQYNGVITKIAVNAVEKEKSSGTEQVVPVEITVTDGDDALKAGYTVDMEIFTALRENALSVPIQSLATIDQQRYVYIIQNETLEKRPITIGLLGDKRVEVLSGLIEGEAVVLNQAEVAD